MASVLNRTTRQYLESVNTPDYPTQGWIHSPDLSAVDGQPAKYWAISGDTVTLMSAGERAAVDAAEAATRKDSVADELDRTETIMRAFAEVVLDEINVLRQRASLQARTLEQLKTAVRGKL